MRATNWVGHTPGVQEFLETDCHLIGEEGVVFGLGEWDCRPLLVWRCLDGIVWTEYVQYEYWDNGPVIFLGLSDPIGNTLGWTVPELENFSEWGK